MLDVDLVVVSAITIVCHGIQDTSGSSYCSFFINWVKMEPVGSFTGAVFFVVVVEPY